MCLTTYALLVATVLYVGQGQTMEDTQNILNTILTGYSSDVRPANNQSLPVQVNVSMEVVNIKEFDEVSEQITIVCILYLDWVDSRLTWDPLDFNDTKYITLPISKIWRPNLILTTPVSSIIPIGGGQDWAVARVFYDGSLIWSPGDTITSWCNVDVSYFPFDKQVCTLTFVPWGYLTSEVLLTGVEDKVRRTFYSENGGWILEDSLVISGDVLEGYFSQFSVTFRLRRRSEFFLVNAVMPIILINCLNVIVFFIPAEAGERVSYAITVFLALAVFMTIVSENMPKNSKHMARICNFLLVNVGHSTVICFETIICLVAYYKEGPVPYWVTRMFCLKPSSICDNRKSELEGKKVKHHEKEINNENGIDIKLETLPTTINQDQERKVSWRDVSKKLDNIFGVFAICLLISFVLTFVIMVATW